MKTDERRKGEIQTVDEKIDPFCSVVCLLSQMGLSHN